MTDLVTLSGDVLTFSPQVSHAPDTYGLLLVAKLQYYPVIQAAEPFEVIVLPCEATLFYGQAQLSLSDVAREWGDPAFFYNI